MNSSHRGNVTCSTTCPGCEHEIPVAFGLSGECPECGKKYTWGLPAGLYGAGPHYMDIQWVTDPAPTSLSQVVIKAKPRS